MKVKIITKNNHKYEFNSVDSMVERPSGSNKTWLVMKRCVNTTNDEFKDIAKVSLDDIELIQYNL